MHRFLGAAIAVRIAAATMLAMSPITNAAWAQAASTETRFELSGPSLSRTHWAVEAARGAEVLGLVDEYLPAQRLVPLEAVERALRESARRSSVEAPRFARIAEGWHARLLEEFNGATRQTYTNWPYVIGGRAGAGIDVRRGGASPGTGEFEPDRSGAIPLPDRTSAIGMVDASIGVGSTLGFRARTGWDGETVVVTEMEMSGSWGPIRTSIGRLPVGYGYGFGGGAILTGDAPLDAVQVYTRRPLRLPSILSLLGPFSLHAFAGAMWEDRHPDDPYIWGASGQFRPFERVTLGVHRAAFFGGDEPVTFDRIFDMLVGRVAGIGFEDQIVSVSGRVVLPTEHLLPLELYLEWAAEDAAGAWFDVPGRVFGAWTPALTFAPFAGVGVEYAHFATSCCGNPSWYRHWSFPGAWASRDLPLGHPIGGDGSEVLLHGLLAFPDAGVRLRTEAVRRNRREENLYSPGRSGASNGVSGELEWAPTSRLRLEMSGSREVGSTWSETTLHLLGKVLF